MLFFFCSELAEDEHFFVIFLPELTCGLFSCCTMYIPAFCGSSYCCYVLELNVSAVCNEHPSLCLLFHRYSDTTKTVFACLVYAPVLPLAMWLCLASLTLSYWADKYLFMRAWRTPVPAGQSGALAKLARRHLALAVLAHCLFALYYYAGWPFDHICRVEVSSTCAACASCYNGTRLAQFGFVCSH